MAIASAQPGLTRHERRNRAEAAVRAQLADLEHVYVLRSSWRTDVASSEPFVAVIARNSDARDSVRTALGDLAGLSAEEWHASWKRLSLGDWMLWVFPERVATR